MKMTIVFKGQTHYILTCNVVACLVSATNRISMLRLNYEKISKHWKSAIFLGFVRLWTLINFVESMQWNKGQLSCEWLNSKINSIHQNNELPKFQPVIQPFQKLYVKTVGDITIINVEAIITEHADGAEWAPQVPPAAAAANALLPGTCQQYQVNAMFFAKYYYKQPISKATWCYNLVSL